MRAPSGFSTTAGVAMAVALGIVTAIGDIWWFRSPQKLVRYLGVNPRVRQSGLEPAQDGRIIKQGPRTRPRYASNWTV